MPARCTASKSPWTAGRTEPGAGTPERQAEHAGLGKRGRDRPDLRVDGPPALLPLDGEAVLTWIP